MTQVDCWFHGLWAEPWVQTTMMKKKMTEENGGRLMTWSAVMRQRLLSGCRCLMPWPPHLPVKTGRSHLENGSFGRRTWCLLPDPIFSSRFECIPCSVFPIVYFWKSCQTGCNGFLVRHPGGTRERERESLVGKYDGKNQRTTKVLQVTFFVYSEI